ncbi:hypothetical protein BCR41DRAFT_240247 [Lobosporangium transversale]|uniref:Ion transport domain-containing protein n=1 Tax=Lobosporangium transversale TaxID=64571 RepID=A0A1Y2G850_9FUNG|nr:hypothetical protein BCR41DRAFT_240247 [Lobosporangium transversale]ORY95196.1 hypothetical protein BCR41DRAFT_240247 [Lobosporangium transversale]|eukprot:XP_021875396.1 hypothetical protein BCR41DRAFT_240247 [Lobosporangium transversale]
MAFSIAILHMVHACSNDECMKAPFPKHFFYALSATYFFMAGRYDSVNDLLNEPENWTLHLMMMIYVLFTVILMLNVLIALINTGFTESETWVQTWLVNRLRYVESAENLSYHIAGFRRKYNWFPKAIYYTASEQQVSAFMKRIDNMETSKENDSIQSRLSNISSAVDQLKANMVISGPSNKRHSKDEDKDHLPSSIGATERMQTLECHVEELKVQLTTSQAHMDRRIDDIQKQMKQISDLLLKALPSEE